MAAIKEAAWVAKAEAWLSNVAKDVDEPSDQEALVYLRSRGRDCDDQITKLVESWKHAERLRFEQYNESHQGGRSLEANENNIEALSPIFLRDFWKMAAIGDWAVESTMLRTADWCDISGFEPWWARLVRDQQEKCLQGGLEGSVQAAYCLFNMVRADFALERMPLVARTYLDALLLECPGGRESWVTDADSGVQRHHIPHASSVVFADYRLSRVAPKSAPLQSAMATIHKHQHGDGGWPICSGDDEASIETTAMALHAVMAMKLRGWRRVAARGRDWLCKVQDQDGFWQEAAADPVHLTVLVLDALALVAGDFRLTFGRQPKARVNEKTHDVGPLDTAEQRLAAINNYIREVGEKTGKKITKKQIWSEELYKSPTEFERWQRADPKATKKATDVFNGILAEKPHLK